MNLKIFVSFLTFILLSIGTYAATDKLAEETQSYLDLEQNYNIRSDPDENLSTTDKEPIKIFAFEVDPSKEEIKRRVSVPPFTENNKKSGDGFLVYIRGDNYSLLNRYKSLYDEPQKTLTARKVLSRDTYWVEDENDLSSAFYIKFLDKNLIEKPIVTNDLIRRLIQTIGFSPLWDFFAEYETVSLRNSGRHYSYILRSLPKGAIHDMESVTPLHGLLGHKELLQEVSSKNYSSVEEWKLKELLPKFSQFLVELNFKYGLMIEAHTQNIILSLDKKTGLIKKIYFRDLQDIVIDAQSLARAGIDPKEYAPPGLQMGGIANTYFNERRVDYAQYFGYNISIYAGQVVSNHFAGTKLKLKAMNQFVDDYIRLLEEQSGLEIELDEETSKGHQSLQVARSTSELYTGQFNARKSKIRNSLAMIMQGVYEAYQKAIFQRDFSGNFLQDQAFQLAKKAFISNSGNFSRRIFYSGLDSRKQLKQLLSLNAGLGIRNSINTQINRHRQNRLLVAEDLRFYVQDDQLWAYNAQTQKPLGFVPYISESDLQAIQDQDVGSCQPLIK